MHYLNECPHNYKSPSRDFATICQLWLGLQEVNIVTSKVFVCVCFLQGPDESVFLTSVCFRGDYPLYHHSRIRVTVYHAEELTAKSTVSECVCGSSVRLCFCIVVCVCLHVFFHLCGQILV